MGPGAAADDVDYRQARGEDDRLQDAGEDHAGAMALLVAACFWVAWLLKLGWLADYLSRPVLVGYIHGVAVVLIVGQPAS